MNEAPEDIHHRLDQLRLLATETTDPLAERLVRDMIAELEDQLTADLLHPNVLPIMVPDPKAKLLAALDRADEYRGLAIRAKGSRRAGGL
jgi:hypothetical protein